MKIDEIKVAISESQNSGLLGSVYSFFYPPPPNAPEDLHHILEDLHLSEKMNLKDLLQTIAVLENIIDIKEENKIDPGQFTIFNIEPTVNDHPYKDTLLYNTYLVQLLHKTHTLLVSYYQKGFTKCFESSNNAQNEKIYDTDNLRNSQVFQGLSTTTITSSSSISENNQGCFFDSLRKGLLIKGRHYEDLNAFREAIETFTNDKISPSKNKEDYFSKADLIFYEGGQGLHGVCLEELTQTLDLMIVGAGDCVINWRCDKDTIYAEISESYMTVVKNDGSMEMFILGSDTETLVPIPIDQQNQYTEHSDLTTPNPIVPIFTVTARFDMVKNAENEGYHLEATAYKLISNTPEIPIPDKDNENVIRPY